MTDIKTLEKAARMALKTLEYIDLQDNDRDFLSYKECHDLDEAITALRQAINNNVEQPAQQSAERGEPVGQLMEEAYGRGQVLWFNKPDDFSMLYTSPQRKPWVGLTNKEWQDIVDDSKLDNIGAIKTAIEAKLKEKNS